MALGVVAGQAAGSAAATAGANAVMQNTMNSMVVPGMTEMMAKMTPLTTQLTSTAKDGMLNDAILSGIMGNQAIGQVAGKVGQTSALSAMQGVPANLSFMDKLKGFGGDAMDIFGNENFTNAIDGGTKLFNAWDTHNARNDARDFQDSTLAMSQAAHNRNMAADDRRQNLNF